MAHYNTRAPTFRDSNVNVVDTNAKDRIALGRLQVPAPQPSSQAAAPLSGRVSSSLRFSTGVSSSFPAAGGSGRFSGTLSGANPVSPQVDRKHAAEPAHCPDMVAEICDMFLHRERLMVRDPNYLTNQTEVTEKMRTILVDWLVDVHLKFKLHEETFFLTVDIVDRYLMASRVGRSHLQLVGITALLLAAKYEEIWPPEVKDCLHISANTYTRDDLLRAERNICAALNFKLTVPTPFPFLARLLETIEADATTRSVAFFFLENAMLDYGHLQYMPSQLANSAVFLANVTLRKPDPWNYTLQYYSKSKLESFRSCAAHLLEVTHALAASKYQAVQRKYATAKYNEVSRMELPAALPILL